MLHRVTTLLAVLLATEGVIQVAGTPATTNRRADITLPPSMPGQNMTGQNMPGQNMPGQNMPGQNMPGQNMPGQNTTGQNATGKNMPGGVCPGPSVDGGNQTTGNKTRSKTKSKNGVNIATADITATLGAVTPGGCKKSMAWQSGGQGFDQDKLAERFTLYNNVWGASSAASGSKQTVKCNKFAGGVVDWTTTFNFNSTSPDRDNQVKSFSNIAFAGKPVQISALKKFESSWHWNLSGKSTNLVADVSYDMFTSKSATCTGQGGGCASHEIMIWLQALGGALPAGDKVAGKTVRVGGHHFEVHKGVVGSIPVISLVPVDKKAYRRFDVDFVSLLQKDLTEFGLDPSEYISTVGSGLEPFKGGASLNSQFSMALL